ncbi:MAG: Hpt domain-containing protein [Atopobiaceae bacterium]|nr:Hpt domain-containing protein [Atopobiaceae bacterium]
MTLQELYGAIDADYTQAMRVLRIDRLLDKHIRKFVANGVIDSLLEAGKTMEPRQLFEAAHAAKGVCGNLGLVKLADLSSTIAEEFRDGNARTMSDAEVQETLSQIDALYTKTKDGIKAYASA